MATQQAAAKTQVANNAHVRVKKQDVMEEGKVVKSLYFMVITTTVGDLQVNIGEKTYNEVNKLTN